MRKLAFAIAAVATALAVAPAAMADSWQMLTGNSSPVSTSSTSISASNLGTWVTTINGVATPTPTVGDPNPFTATYTESVYIGGPDALCATCLNFVYTLTNSATTGTDGIANISTTNFGSFSVAEGNITPSSLDSISTGDEPLAGTVDVYLSTPLLAGQALDSFVLFTSAPAYTLGTVTFQDGTTVNASALVAASPEPSSLLLFGTGLLGLAFALFRKNKPVSMELR
ncbi:MAG: PEP-CTERM sorting domain-containing protein [Terracidiphilus sp.]|jgi:hypothetical protein